MEKQTKLIKFLIVLMFIVPVILFIVGVSQTFVLKNKQAKLKSLNQTLSQTQQEHEEYLKTEDYLESEEFKDDYNKYENNKSENNDIIIEIN